jgi:hypothetical protein
MSEKKQKFLLSERMLGIAGIVPLKPAIFSTNARSVVQSPYQKLNDDIEAQREMMSESDDAYDKFFKSALEKFGVSGPDEFKTDAEKKEFFNYVDAKWQGDNEKVEEALMEMYKKKPVRIKK